MTEMPSSMGVKNQVIPGQDHSMTEREKRAVFKVNTERRRLKERIFTSAILVATVMALLVLLYLVTSVALDGASSLSWDFLTNFPSRFPAKAGIKSAIFGSIWLGVLTLFFS